ncbi:hemin-degrading factor [Hydrogenophaga pseudoflava]|uniref:hemin-degrading factor n=1 Tax=Hydrogenophaga pseudoflava TaxID=47421 RepID=UPI0027E50D16|nr:ChuX/HutX family heme-like substrate-binding protein [Hydrogenophaga pseudoflava]MDQ7746953.1 ChuX/HutX family heme-like substrate-binding protein [Hydrogenophaga pseudoflava]
MNAAPIIIREPAMDVGEKAEELRQRFAQARARGLRAREAADAIGLSEGAAVAAHVGAHSQPLRAVPVQPRWLEILQALETCGPLMALTRNDSTVHEKTGVYRNLSSSGPVGLALGEDIDLRLFFNHWHAGFVVTEVQASGTEQASLQFFDAHGTAVHKVYPRAQTELSAWAQLHQRWADPLRAVAFRPGRAPDPTSDAEDDAAHCAADFAQAWAQMTDTHQFFGLLRRFGLERQQAFGLVEGRFTQRVDIGAVRQLLLAASLDATPLMVFVGSPGCIQIHTGPVRRVEPMAVHGKTWLNVLDPGFNLHLREDLIAGAWIVEKPGDCGTVTSLEVFDHEGGLMAMFFGARQPGQPERENWRALLEPLRHTGEVAA